MAGERSREVKAVIAALVLHAALALTPRRSPPVPGDAPGEAPAPAATFDIEQDPAPAPASEEPAAPAAAPEAPKESPPAAANAKVAPRAITEAKPATPEAPPSEGAGVEGPASAKPPAPGPGVAGGPSNPGAGEYGPPPGGDSLGLPPGMGAPIWSLPGGMPSAATPRAAPTVAGAPRPVDPNIAGQVLGGSLHNKDKTVGIEIPGAGVVATTLADTVRASTPLNARATFEVKLGGDGKVEGIRMVSASAGDASTWDRIVRAAQGTLAARSLQMGGDGKGATVVVKVESSVEYPAGSKNKLDIEPVCANEVIEQLEAAIKSISQAGSAGVVRGLRDESGTFIPYNDMNEEQRRRFCIPIGIRGKGDTSNIGAHATNVVRSAFKVIRAGEKALPAEGTLPVDTRVPWAPADPTKVRPTTPAPLKKKKKKWR